MTDPLEERRRWLTVLLAAGWGKDQAERQAAYMAANDFRAMVRHRRRAWRGEWQDDDPQKWRDDRARWERIEEG